MTQRSLARRIRLVVAAASASLALALAAPAAAQWLKHPDPRIPRTADGKPDLTAPAPRLPDGKPDLNGLWNAVDGRFLTNIARRAGIEAPFQPWAKALFDERQANLGRDRPAGFCLPHGVPDAMLVPGYPWKLVQTPGLTIILYENFTDFRQIFTDGRAHPAERGPTWFGYSVGRWDGDVFVVDTVGFNGKTWLDDGGHPKFLIVSPTFIIVHRIAVKGCGDKLFVSRIGKHIARELLNSKLVEGFVLVKTPDDVIAVAPDDPGRISFVSFSISITGEVQPPGRPLFSVAW